MSLLDPRQRSIRAAAMALVFVAITGCHGGQPRQRPIGEGVRQYFASRPTYQGMPSRTFSLGSYAGYNYGQGRPVVLEPPAPPVMIGD